MVTADFVAYYAAERPGGIAFIDNGREIAFAELDRDIARLAQALGEFGLPRGGVVAICCADFYRHFLLIFACERLALATATFHGELQLNKRIVASADLVLADPGTATEGAKRVHTISKEWLDGALTREGTGRAAPPAYFPDDPIRIIRSSGTTGFYKRMLVTRKVFDARVQRYGFIYEFTPRSRYLITMPLTVAHVYACASVCLRQGGAVVLAEFEGQASVAEAVSRYGVTHTTLFPIQIKQVLDHLTADFVKPPALMVYAQGARISETLHRRALARLASEVACGYGTNETASLCCTRVFRPDGSVTICPGVAIEVVDDHDRPLGPGELGKMRIKSDTTVDGYIEEPEAARQMFRDGWFYPGDLAILAGPSQVKVVARADDLLNLGGGKFSPEELEEWILKENVVGDVAVCGMPNAEGITELLIAVVGARCGDQELIGHIAHAFEDASIGNFNVIKLPQIPRGPTGKILRDLLKKKLADSLPPNR